jgi:hypothetical protein
VIDNVSEVGFFNGSLPAATNESVSFARAAAMAATAAKESFALATIYIEMF